MMENFADKYRMYSIHLQEGLGKRMIMVHVGRPISFKTFCDDFVFQHIELTIQSSGAKIPTVAVIGLQKIPNENIPAFELTAEGILRDIPK